MEHIQERCTLTNRHCTKDRYAGRYTYFTFISSVIQNLWKKICPSGLPSIENTGKLLVYLPNCAWPTKSEALAAAVIIPSHVFCLIMRKNKYVLKDAVKPLATFSVVTTSDAIRSPV